MVLNGLPEEYNTFQVIITQKENPITFSDFKTSIKNFEETEMTRKLKGENQDNVMKVGLRNKNKTRSNEICTYCNKNGHSYTKCWFNPENSNKSRIKRFCINCHMTNHDTKFCRRRNNQAVKLLGSDHDKSNETLLFKITAERKTSTDDNNSLLVDCGATIHIISDKTKFISMNKSFNPATHFIELADGTRKNNLAIGKGDAKIILEDTQGNKREVILKDTLCIPGFQNILSVTSILEKGASITLNPNNTELKAQNGTTFKIKKKGKLFYLNYCNQIKSHELGTWHKIFGHLNLEDLIKMENAVQGMKITNKNEKFDCKVCAKGKMFQTRNREPDKRAKSILDLVHSDVAGPIDPVSRDGYKYTLLFIDDYSGIIFTYFLKNKSDVATATKRFLCDMRPYGSIKE